MTEKRLVLARRMGKTDRNYYFDPFNNAGDDYEVLKWMRSHGGVDEICKSLDWHPIDYQVGDYARAAMKSFSESSEHYCAWCKCSWVDCGPIADANGQNADAD